MEGYKYDHLIQGTLENYRSILREDNVWDTKKQAIDFTIREAFGFFRSHKLYVVGCLHKGLSLGDWPDI